MNSVLRFTLAQALETTYGELQSEQVALESLDALFSLGELRDRASGERSSLPSREDLWHALNALDHTMTLAELLRDQLQEATALVESFRQSIHERDQVIAELLRGGFERQQSGVSHGQ